MLDHCLKRCSGGGFERGRQARRTSARSLFRGFRLPSPSTVGHRKRAPERWISICPDAARPGRPMRCKFSPEPRLFLMGAITGSE